MRNLRPIDWLFVAIMAFGGLLFVVQVWWGLGVLFGVVSLAWVSAAFFPVWSSLVEYRKPAPDWVARLEQARARYDGQESEDAVLS